MIDQVNYSWFSCRMVYINPIAPTRPPINQATMNSNGFVIPPANTAKTPPWGTKLTDPKSMLKAPETPAPMAKGGITRTGLEAANGIAPSVIKAAPMT